MLKASQSETTQGGSTMETLITEYIISFVDCLMTIFFCLYIFKSSLLISSRRLILIALLLSGFGCFLDLSFQQLLTKLNYPYDVSAPLLPLWFIAGYLCLRKISNESRSQILFVLFLSFQVRQLGRCITYLIYGLCFPSMISTSYYYGDILGFGIPAIILTPLIAMYSYKFCFKLKQLDLKEYIRLWLIPLFFILLYLVQSNLYPVDDYLLANGFRIMIFICSFITYSQMISAISYASKAAQESEYHTQLSHQLDLQKMRLEDMESHAEELKRIRHDRRQHVAVLRGLLNHNDVDKALTYLDDYEETMTASIQTPLCENFVADLLCRRYETLARQAGIKVEFNLLLPNDIGIISSDLAVMLGNLWENAVTAALDAKENHRFIKLKAQFKDNILLLRMENGYSGIIYKENDSFLSTKPNRNKTAGLGIVSIQSVAAKYGGITDFTYTEDIFTASLLLYPKVINN